jgi:surfactin synthase thioesterase subunit
VTTAGRGAPAVAGAARWWSGHADPRAGTPVVLAFPFAGGGARFYQPWRARLAGQGEVLAAQLPGRERRIREPPRAELDPLVGELVDAWPEPRRPYLLFGHSLGATMAYAVTCELRRRGLPEPAELILSAAPAPHLRDRADQAHRLDDAAFVLRLRRYNGTAPEVFDSPDLLALLLPTIRADFALFETWEPPGEAPLAMPFTVLGGTADKTVTLAQLQGWRSLTAGRCDLRLLPGDHFFVSSAGEAVVGVVRDALRRVAGPAAAAP